MLPLGSMFFIASKTPLLHQLIQLHSLLELHLLRINMTSTINDLIYRIVAKQKKPRCNVAHD